LPEKLRRGLGDRVDGARTFDVDIARDTLTASLAASTATTPGK
jgi:hypothetical protein